MNLARLTDPFPASDVEWRIQSSGAKADGTVWARVLAYITNRAIMERLDEVCGPENWRNEYRYEQGGAVLCGISIFTRVPDREAQWVTKWDGAENTDIEAVKGGLSGAMKRAGYQWGIGRYLYQLEEGFATVSDRGAYYAKTKDGKAFKWDPPALPLWALPGGAGKENGSGNGKHPAPLGEPAHARTSSTATASVPQPTAHPNAQTATDGEDDPSCPKCGGKLWDNRISKRNPKAPDWKCRSRSCDGVIWPPKPAVLHADGPPSDFLDNEMGF